MNLGIFQPEKIGDIIITLPIAKYYNDMGYNIIWPVSPSLLSHFKGYVDYVNFIEYSSYNDFILKYDCPFVLNLCFNIYGNELYTNFYNTQLEYTFDELKYKIANVPFEKKWSLQINRNKDREHNLYNSLIKQDKYLVFQNKSSSHIINRNINVSKEYQIINIEPITNSIFDWLTIIEKSSGVCLIESCFTNLIDQLNIKIDKKYCILKHNYYGKKLINRDHNQGMPILKNNWNYI